MNRQELLSRLFQSMGQLRRGIDKPGTEISHIPSVPTRAQMGILFMVKDASKSVKDLAALSHMSPSAVTQLVNGLVKENLLYRVEDPIDRRKTQVSITKHGKEKMAHMKKKILEQLEYMCSDLTIEELTMLQKIQQKMINKITS